jgi:hypothetical protein
MKFANRALLAITDGPLNYGCDSFTGNAPLFAVGRQQPVGNSFLPFARIATAATKRNVFSRNNLGIVDYVFPTC